MEYPVTGAVYQHYKRKEHYKIIGVATDSDTEEPVVVYKALYGEGRLFVRKLSVFGESVDHEDETVRRFTLIA